MAAPSGRTVRVLVIEAHADTPCPLETTLAVGNRAHYTVERTASRAAALEAMHAGGYDLACLIAFAADDHTVEFARELCAETAETPLLVIAPTASSEFESTVLAAGAVDLLNSSDAAELPRVEGAIDRALRHAATIAELRETRRMLDRTAKTAAAVGERNRSTQLLHSILRNLPVIAGQLDATSRVVDAQGAGLLPQGIRPERLIGRVFTDLFPQSRGPIGEALAGGSSNFILSGRARGQEWHAEFFVSFDSGQRSGATFLGRDITERRWLEVNLLGTADAEQQRLGTDIHDGLGQHLTGLAFMAAALRDRLKTSLPEEVGAADALAKLARDATVQSRALARGLHPVQLEKHGFVAAFEELATQSQVLHGIACRFRVRGPLPTLEHSAELHLYRIAQEAIRNAVRHGAGQNLLITLASAGTNHRLTVRDDGGGFDPAQVRATTAGRGLRLMGYRAAMIGGALSVESHPGHGTRISCLFSSPSLHENDRAVQSPPLAPEVLRPA